MKVIILAAGRGKRMKDLTNNKPKCFLKVNGEKLITRLINQLKRLGIKDISIVRGYNASKFNFKNIKYFTNKFYKKTNMFYSLMLAREKLNYDTLIVYSDIILSPKIIKKMIKAKKSFSIAVDVKWKNYWKFRFKNIKQDLETLKMNKKNQIKKIGKPTKNLKDIDGRFIGIIKTSKNMNKKIISLWDKEIKNFKNKKWGISGKSLEKAYMTDLINKLIDLKVKCYGINFENGWYEFDNKEDYIKFPSYKLNY